MRKLSTLDIVNSIGSDVLCELFNKTNNRYIGVAVEKYITEKLSVAHYLNLHSTKHKKILDIGTGVGWFPYICKQYGHDCLGTDIANRNNYDPIYKKFKIDIEEILVYPKEKINLNQRYDYIVSLRSFIGSRPQAFSLDDWKFFLTDINKYIIESGGLYLGCNSIDTRGIYKALPHEQKSHWGDLKLEKLFRPFVIPPDKKLKIKPNTIYIPKENLEEVIKQL